MRRGERYKAKIAGLKHYNTGKPCRYGHTADRNVKDTACLECRRLQAEKERTLSPDKHRLAVRKFRLANPEKRKEQEKKAHYKNKEKRNAYCREYSRLNRKRLNEYRSHFYKNNPEKRKTIGRSLRARLKAALVENLNGGSAVRDLGCSIEDFKRYVATKFYDGMTWENHGVVWQLDHIKPLADFDLTQRSQLLEACHFTNLQPLTNVDHKLKTAKELRNVGHIRVRSKGYA